MFVFPPLPPKDHVIKEIPRTLLSSQVFSPNRLRVTIPEIGKQAVPIELADYDLPPTAAIQPVNSTVVDSWVHRDRHNWVVAPGKEDYFVHDMYKKYNVVVCDSYDIRYLHTPPVFPRSFKYELDCMENFRLKKLHEKMERNAAEDAQRIENQTKQFDESELPNEANEREQEQGVNSELPKPPETTYTTSYVRWQPQPHLFAPSQTDPCIRRQEFGFVGRPFKSEACNWYFENYPPPKIEWKPHRFS